MRPPRRFGLPARRSDPRPWPCSCCARREGAGGLSGVGGSLVRRVTIISEEMTQARRQSWHILQGLVSDPWHCRSAATPHPPDQVRTRGHTVGARRCGSDPASQLLLAQGAPGCLGSGSRCSADRSRRRRWQPRTVCGQAASSTRSGVEVTACVASRGAVRTSGVGANARFWHRHSAAIAHAQRANYSAVSLAALALGDDLAARATVPLGRLWSGSYSSVSLSAQVHTSTSRQPGTYLRVWQSVRRHRR